MATVSSQLILSLIDKVSGPARGVGGALMRLNGLIDRTNRMNRASMAPVTGFAGRLLALGAGYVGVTQGVQGTVGAAMDFESAMSDVRKVIDVTDAQFGQIRKQVLGLTKTLPVTAEGMAAIFAAGGQSNIPVGELRDFSEMVAKVSVAWDIAQGDTGQALAEIKNQLRLNVRETGLYADAINELSNTSAARAPDLVDYSKRVAATGELYGFTATQTLAFGGAMIATGAQSEVAATSFRNMGRALTIGTRATKMHREAYKRLGLDSVRTAKNMQKNALNTTLDVIDRIQKLPEWERISIASALFGDEARALMPVINNAGELRRQLGLVGDAATYAGSANREFEQRAKTTANTLQLVRNNVRAIGIEIGDRMLPGINNAAQGILHIFDTLGDRATIFDKLKAAFQGFMSGLGLDSGDAASALTSIRDLIFGAEGDAAGAAETLGRIFMEMKGWGESVRALSDAIEKSPLAGFLGTVTSYGTGLAIASIGFGIFAASISGLARALYFLTGAKAAVGVIRALAQAGGSVASLFKRTAAPAQVAAPKSAPAPVKAPANWTGPWGENNPGAPKGVARPGPTGPRGLGSTLARPTAPRLGLSGALKGVGGGVIGTVANMVGEYAISSALEAISSRLYTPEQRRKTDSLLNRSLLSIPNDLASPIGRLQDFRAPGYEPPRVRAGVSDVRPMPSGPVQDVAEQLRGVTLRTQSEGVSQVQVTNPPPRPNVTVNVPVTINEATDAGAILGMIQSGIGAAVKSAVEGSYQDGAD